MNIQDSHENHHDVLSFPSTDMNGDIAYSILEGDDEEQFEISDEGVISTRAVLDRESKSSYNLVVLAQGRLTGDFYRAILRFNRDYLSKLRAIELWI